MLYISHVAVTGEVNRKHPAVVIENNVSHIFHMVPHTISHTAVTNII